MSVYLFLFIHLCIILFIFKLIDVSIPISIPVVPALYRQQVFTQRSFYTERLLHSKLLHTAAFTENVLHVEALPRKMHDSEGFWVSNRKITSAKLTHTSPWRPSCSHSITIYHVQLQKTIVYYARSRDAKEPWRSHCTAICKHCIARHNTTMHSTQETAGPKPDLDAKAEKCAILKVFEQHFII